MANPHYAPLLQLIEKKGARQEIFTFAELRDELGIDASDRRESQKVWNAWNQAKNRKIIKHSDPYEGRSRNRRYAMGDIGALSQELAHVAGRSDNGKVTHGKSRATEQSIGQGMMDRLSRIEERLNSVVGTLNDANGGGDAEQFQAIVEKLEILDAKVNRLLQIWA